MQQIIEQIRILQKDGTQSFKTILKNSCSINQISYNIFSKLSLKKIQKNVRYLKKAQIISSNRISELQKIWIENQLVLFRIIINCYSWFNQLPIKKFNLQNWTALSEMFRNKQIYILKYEAKNLMVSGHNTRRSWTNEQQHILNQLKAQFGEDNRWNEIARSLYLKSDFKYFRLGKHCRQHWLAYLDPRVYQVKQKMSLSSLSQSDCSVLCLLKKYGRKWVLITQELELSISPIQLKKKFNTFLKQIQTQNDLQNIHEAITFILCKLNLNYKQREIKTACMKRTQIKREVTQKISYISNLLMKINSHQNIFCQQKQKQNENHTILHQSPPVSSKSLDDLSNMNAFKYSNFSAFNKCQAHFNTINNEPINFGFQWFQMMKFYGMVQYDYQSAQIPANINIHTTTKLYRPYIIAQR